MVVLMISRKSQQTYWNSGLEIERVPGPLSTSGFNADGHRVQMYVSITNTEGVLAILMISWSRGGHIGFNKILVDEILHTLRKMSS